MNNAIDAILGHLTKSQSTIAKKNFIATVNYLPIRAPEIIEA